MGWTRRHDLPLLLGLLVGACGDDDSGVASSLDGGATEGIVTSTGDDSSTSGRSTETGTASRGSDTTSNGDSQGVDTGEVDTTGDTSGGTSADDRSSDDTTDGLDSSSTDTGDTTGTTGTTGEICDVGVVVCMGDVSYECDGMGGFENPQNCDPGLCVDGLGCVDCLPGGFACSGDEVEQCNQAGDGWDVVETCDGLLGLTCDANLGKCVGPCASLGLTYLGCDYYPTVTANIVGTNFNFAVVVSNTSNDPADVTVTKGAAIVAQATVAGGSVEIINLPWVPNLMSSSGPPAASIVEPEGAYRLRTTRPVTVYQYNPIEYNLGASFSFTNDASLLLPVNTWGEDYFVAARNTWQWGGFTNYPGFYAVVASEDGTTISVDPSSTGSSNILAGGGIGANGQGMVVLDQGDVLQVVSGGAFANPSPIDLTGTRITSDKPIQVISGHQCTFVPHNVGYCDHLEESMLPFDTLASEYIVTTPLVQPLGGNAFAKDRFVRIVATTDATTLAYDPPQPGAPAAIANAGDYVEIGPTSADFSVSANFKILVSEYMQGQDAGGNTGDPAMAIAVPTLQYRTSYLVHAPTNYESNFVNITAPTGSTVLLNGGPVMNFAPIGNTGYEIARVELSNVGDGTHELTGDQPFGVTVYGYGQYTSYWYPGGMDLDIIPQ
jgi:hypothetical protein